MRKKRAQQVFNQFLRPFDFLFRKFLFHPGLLKEAITFVAISNGSENKGSLLSLSLLFSPAINYSWWLRLKKQFSENIYSTPTQSKRKTFPFQGKCNASAQEIRIHLNPHGWKKGDPKLIMLIVVDEKVFSATTNTAREAASLITLRYRRELCFVIDSRTTQRSAQFQFIW